MMESIQTYLEKAEKANVKLYFIERYKNQRKKEIRYDVLKTTISTEIGDIFIDTAKRQIQSKLDRDPEYFEYGVMPYSERNHIETIKMDEVPYLSNLITQISDIDIDIFKDNRIKKIFGYVITIECEDRILFLFRKYTPKKLLEKGKIAMLFRDNGFYRVSNQIMAIDEVYDAALLLIEKGDESLTNVFILHRAGFESLFSFVDIYKKKIDEDKNDVKNIRFLDNIDSFIEFCKDDSRKIKKLARILKNGIPQDMTREKINNVVKEFKLTDVEFDDDEKIIVTKKNIWTILKILDEDHGRTEITKRKIETQSKSWVT